MPTGTSRTAPSSGSRALGRRPTVVLVSNLLGMGGTEKGMVNDALQLSRDRWDVRVVGVWGLGPRAATLEQAGIPVDSADRDLDRLTGLFEGADVVHVYRQGGTEPLVPTAARAARVPVLLETNIFGQFDASRDRDLFACHLFISKFCLMRYRQRIGDSTAAFHVRHRTQPLGLDLNSLKWPPKEAAKEALGLDPRRPVVGRVGRAADGKWRNLLIDMMPRVTDLVPNVQFMWVGTTPAKEARLRRRGMLDTCSLQPTTTDDARLAAYYAACDVFVTAAEIGESQGVAIAEAMACGVPVVTCSTPWADNAQIEFVDHGRTGYIANHPRSFAEAVTELLTDEGRRIVLGDAARATVESTLNTATLARQLERLYEELLNGVDAPPAWWSPSAAEVDAFTADYPRRLRAEYSCLTLRERAEMRCERAAERCREMAREATAHVSRDGVITARQRVAAKFGRAHA